MRPWWERWPGRLEWELQSLRDANIQFEIRNQDSRTGLFDLSMEVPINGELVKLEVHFPALFPFTRVEVFAPGLNLDWHQNPYTKNLCLIGRSSDEWSTNESTAAFILGQLKKLLEAVQKTQTNEVADLELHQAEPVTVFLNYIVDSFILFDSSWQFSAVEDSGRMRLRLSSQLPVRGIVQEFQRGTNNDAGRFASTVDDEAIRKLGLTESRLASWYRLGQSLGGLSADQCIQRLEDQFEMRAVPLGGYDLVGVIVPEEAGWRAVGETLVFILRTAQKRNGFRYPVIKNHFIRGFRLGRDELLARAPELKPASSKRIALVGLGCVGAPSALEFAKAGISELRLMDGDVVEPGNSVRWPLGIQAVGHTKGEAIAAFIESNYPFTKVKTSSLRFGGTHGSGGGTLEDVAEFLRDIDLIYDATAEVGVSYLLSELAREMRIPFVCASSTLGALGGRVVTMRPGQTAGCWNCLRMHTYEGALPTPLEASNGISHIRGCADPAFTGASFDVQQVALAGVRAAISTLSESSEGGYPSLSWDVAILGLRDEHGAAIVPTWQIFPLTRHAECTNHPT
jgi:ThiF family protein